jgi:branched-chain amino acid transport system ATP-binding protein
LGCRMLLEVDGLVVGYGKTQVLNGLSFTLDEGASLAILGANGAGKSTLMMTLAGLLRPWRGRIRFDGEDVTSATAQQRASIGIALVPEGRRIFSSLSIEENLLIGATALKRRLGATIARSRVSERLDEVYEMFPVLRERRRSRGSQLSGGQQQMLAIGRALMAEPRVLLLDEPCLGLAPRIGNDVYDALARVLTGGQSVIVVEESSRRALDFAARAIIVKLGTKVLEDDAHILKHDGRLLNAYFGIVHAGEAS